MALCERCGSINIVSAGPQRADRILGLFGRGRSFVCRRCGWRGRRNWTDDDLHALSDYGAGGGALDPGLAALDVKPTDTGLATSRGGGPAAGSSWRRTPELEGLELDQLDLVNASAAGLDSEESSNAAGRLLTRIRPRSLRRKDSRRREVIATIAVSALVMFLIVMIGLAGSCAGGADAP